MSFKIIVFSESTFKPQLGDFVWHPRKEEVTVGDKIQGCGAGHRRPQDGHTAAAGHGEMKGFAVS